MVPPLGNSGQQNNSQDNSNNGNNNNNNSTTTNSTNGNLTINTGINNPINSTATAVTIDKDKGTFGKLFHYLNEMKKELELAQKQRREGQLENQRLREKCQQLDDRLATEQVKGTGT